MSIAMFIVCIKWFFWNEWKRTCNRIKSKLDHIRVANEEKKLKKKQMHGIAQYATRNEEENWNAKNSVRTNFQKIVLVSTGNFELIFFVFFLLCIIVPTKIPWYTKFWREKWIELVKNCKNLLHRITVRFFFESVFPHWIASCNIHKCWMWRDLQFQIEWHSNQSQSWKIIKAQTGEQSSTIYNTFTRRFPNYGPFQLCDLNILDNDWTANSQEWALFGELIRWTMRKGYIFCQ